MAYFLLHCPQLSVLYVLFLEAATEKYSLKEVQPKTKQNCLKLAVSFVKLNFSRVIFKGFLVISYLVYIFRIQEH